METIFRKLKRLSVKPKIFSIKLLFSIAPNTPKLEKHFTPKQMQLKLAGTTPYSILPKVLGMQVVHVMNHNIVLVGHKKLGVKRQAIINYPLTANHTNH